MLFGESCSPTLPARLTVAMNQTGKLLGRRFDDSISTGGKGRGRWILCWFLFASTVLNYLDRQSIALVKGRIMGEFSIDNETFGWVIAAFGLTYSLFQLPAGFVADRANLKRAYAGAVFLWSLSAVLMAWSPTLGALVALRAILGIPESLNWPCALKVTERVLEPAERSLGNGIFNSGAAAGAIVTPLVVPLLAERFGWRGAFVCVGSLGFLWVIAWLITLSRGPGKLIEGARPAAASVASPAAARNRFFINAIALSLFAGCVGLGYYELRVRHQGAYAIWMAIAAFMFGSLLVAAMLPRRMTEGAPWARSLSEVVRLRRFWACAVAGISVNICWHFLVNWLPAYLQEDRDWTGLAAWLGRWSQAGSTRKETVVLMLSAVPFLAADAGNLLGGWSARRLAGRGGFSPRRSRLAVMGVCSALIALGGLVSRLESNAQVLVVLGLMALGTAAFMANYFAFAQDVSQGNTGVVVGILGALANLCAAGFHPFTGRIRDHFGHYGPVFWVAGLLPAAGFLALWAGWGGDREASAGAPG